MKDFFKGVRKHIGKLDAEHLREQYALVSDELARSEMLLHSLRDGIVVLDTNGETTRANPAAKELFGMDPSDFIERLAIPLGRASKREVTVTYPDARTLEIQTLPVGDETVVIARDITSEKNRTAEELASGATKAVRDLAAGVAHEIGNPLNAISLNLQLLEREHRGDETIAECRRQVARLDGIIRGFLQALRPAKPNLVPGSLAEPVKNCLATLRRQIEEHEFRVSLEMPAALPTAALDKDQLEQVFFNLLKNAMEAMKDGGEIGITLGSDDDSVFAEIRDTGAGMSSEQLAHLFEAYRTTKARGTGLGLMISARIVHDHGGTIAAESEPDKGTTFTVKIPRIEKRIRALDNHG